MKVKELKRFLSKIKDDAEVIDHTGEPIVHVLCDGRFLLSSVKPIGFCKKCGLRVYPEIDSELNKEYSGYCPNCYVNLYKFEIEYDENTKR